MKIGLIRGEKKSAKSVDNLQNDAILFSVGGNMYTHARNSRPAASRQTPAIGLSQKRSDFVGHSTPKMPLSGISAFQLFTVSAFAPGHFSLSAFQRFSFSSKAILCLPLCRLETCTIFLHQVQFSTSLTLPKNSAQSPPAPRLPNSPRKKLHRRSAPVQCSFCQLFRRTAPVLFTPPTAPLASPPAFPA